MQHLLRIEYDDVLHNLAAKTMLCKIYFSLGETDALENQLDSIQIYLCAGRKKVLGYARQLFSHSSVYSQIADNQQKQRFRKKKIAGGN